MNETLLIVLINLAVLPIVFGLGILKERVDWNKLIEEGKLPKPRRKYTFNSYDKKLYER